MAKGLLLGAGFSFDLGMPLASEFSDILFSYFDSKKMTNIINNMRGHSPYNQDRILCDRTLSKILEIYNDFLNSDNKNYEELFRIIENLLLYNNAAIETRSFFLSKLRSIINELFLIYQIRTYCYYLLNREKYHWLLNEFSDEELWIFTLNHDILVEMLCIDYNIPLREGYSNTIQFPQSNLNLEECMTFGRIDACEVDIENLNYPIKSKGINILKIHGGLNEYFQGDDKTGRNRLLFSSNKYNNSLEYLRQLEHFIHEPHYFIDGNKLNIDGEICFSDFDKQLQFMQPSILTGSRKYQNTLISHRREEKIELFSSGLKKIDELFIIGYSFCDKHINNRIVHAMHLNDKLKITVINPNCEKQSIFEPFDYNLRIRYCNTVFPTWANYQMNGKWDLDFQQTIDNITSSVRKPLFYAIKNSILNK